VELHRGTAKEISASTLVEKGVANQSVTGSSQPGHSFQFNLAGKGFSAGQLLTIKATSLDGQRFRATTPDALK